MKTKALFEIEIDTNGIYCMPSCQGFAGDWCDLLNERCDVEKLSHRKIRPPRCIMAVYASKDETVKAVISAAVAQSAGE